MKRDILIFPKFENIDKIQEIRNKYDLLASLVPPHITIVFPFSDDISNEELISLVREAVKNIKPFNVTFKGAKIEFDPYTNSNYIYVDCIEGKESILNLHDLFYSIPPFKSHFNPDIKYIPHITLGHTDTIDFILEDTFKYLVDELVIEGIGKNEESIIIDTIKLG